MFLISCYVGAMSAIVYAAAAAVLLWMAVAALYLSVVLLALVLRLSAKLLAKSKMRKVSRSLARAANWLDDGSLLVTWEKSLGSTLSPATRDAHRQARRLTRADRT